MEHLGTSARQSQKKAYKRNHEIIAFEIDNKKTRKTAKKYRKKVKDVFFGDILDFSTVSKAVKESDAVIHLATISPPVSKKNRQLTMDVNLGGTVNIVDAIKQNKEHIPFIFTSSASVMGPTQLQDKNVTLL